MYPEDHGSHQTNEPRGALLRVTDPGNTRIATQREPTDQGLRRSRQQSAGIHTGAHLTIIRCTNCEFDKTRTSDDGYEVIAIEDDRWPTGHTGSEILWATEGQPITEDELPF